MNIKSNIKIVATGEYLPESVSSFEIEEKYNLPQGWSERYSGVRTRHQVTFESNGYMGARSIESALESSALDLSDIDLIISAGATFDYPLPNQSSVIKSELKDGLKYNVPTIDIDTTCLSFVTSLDIASKMIDNYQYKNVIIVTSEISSKGLNSKDPETLTLFGDASVAVVVSADESGESHFIKGDMKTYAEGLHHTIIQGGGNEFFFKDNPYDEDLFSFDQDYGTEFSLPDGDKEPFQQMTFTLADEQAEQIKNAIADIKQTDEYKYCETLGNENSNGNARNNNTSEIYKRVTNIHLLQKADPKHVENDF